MNFLSYIFYQENLALYKPTFQSTDYGRYFKAATDGNMNDFSVEGGHCVETKDSMSHAYVGVDLGGLRSIERIRVYAITGNKEWGLYFSLLSY